MAAKRIRPATLLVLLAAAVVAWFVESRTAPPRRPDAGPTREDSTAGGAAAPAAIEAAFAARRSGVWVEGRGVIVHLLPDDRQPPRHQLCLVELPSGRTIKVSHNVDLAPKVPWSVRDDLAFRGRYEFNDLGGVVHWTHRDPDGRQEGGWLEHAGRRYR